jgi:hypothetical protein
MTASNGISLTHRPCGLLDERRTYSKAKIGEIASKIDKLPPGCCVAVTGSYGRLEAGSESDFDFFLMAASDAAVTKIEEARKNVTCIVKNVVGRLPSADGAFATTMNVADVLRNIGGNEEKNEDITRRILLLIEGRFVAGDETFDAARRQLLNRYITEKISTHQLGLFFLNDLIRYYRTMCVDFEYKTVEQGKGWGLRNIKLVFSRKLIYFGGVVIAAEMAQRTHAEKIELAEQLIHLTPTERIIHVCGASAQKAINSYVAFLEKMQSREFRELLENTPSDRTKHCEEFKRVKNDGHYFTWHLLSALQATYHATHPIHKCLIM